MRPYRIFLTLLMTACLISLSANASAFFNNYPEDTVPGWQTPSPYQRNIYLDFLSDPTGGPPGPIPGAEYEGYLDSELWDSDDFNYTELTLESGRVGIADGGAGELILYINNLANTNPVKRIYMEATVTVSNAFQAYIGEWLDAYYSLPPGHTVIDSDYDVEIINLGTGELLLTGWVEIWPNPAWESAIVEFNVPQGQWAWVHDLHIASECVAPSACESDFDFDGDVDGLELARLAASDIEVGLDAFGPEFGESGCLL
jgi:hypothetical protein